MPEPLGKPVNIYAFVDANHAGNINPAQSHLHPFVCSELTNHVVKLTTIHRGNVNVWE
jgi:hypothetical protein